MADTAGSITAQSNSSLGLNIGGYNFNLPVPATVTEKIGKVTDVFTANKNNLQNLANIAGGLESVAKGNLQVNVGTPTVKVENPTIVLPASEVIKRIMPYALAFVIVVILAIVMLKRG
jgi:hypothetical protein